MIGIIKMDLAELKKLDKFESFVNITKQIPADETTDIKKIEENTDTISLTFKSRDIRNDSVNYEVYSTIVRSIRVLESESVEFSIPILIKNIQNDVAPEEWDDLFALKKYNEVLFELQNRYDSEKSSHDNEVDKLQQKYFMEKANNTSSVIGMLKKIIVFKTDFRRLLLEVIPDLEIQFKQKFDAEQQKQIENCKTDKKTFADYLSAKDKDAVIVKILALDRKTPSSIFIILKALFDGGTLLMSDNNAIYEAYYNQFGYRKDFETLKRSLSGKEWIHVDKKFLQKIENMKHHLCD